MNIPDKAKKAGTDALGDYVERCNEWDTEDAANITLWNAARFIAAQVLRDAADMVDGLDADVDYEETTEAAGRRHAAKDLIARADELERP